MGPKTSSPSSSATLLQTALRAPYARHPNRLKQIQNAPTLPKIHATLVDNNIVTTWQISIHIDISSSLYPGAHFRGILRFPPNYPFTSPTFRFKTPV
jgi:ubiquitin-protein ligase